MRHHRTSYFQPKSSSFCYVTVYVNHRPAFGLSPFDLHEAFNKLGIPGDQGFAIDRDRLLSLLQNKGMGLTIVRKFRKEEVSELSVSTLMCNQLKTTPRAQIYPGQFQFRAVV